MVLCNEIKLLRYIPSRKETRKLVTFNLIENEIQCIFDFLYFAKKQPDT